MKSPKLGRILLFPPTPIAMLMFPVSVSAMLYGMLFLGEAHPFTVVFYALSFYGLTVLCVRIPRIVKAGKSFKDNNKYLKLWSGDVRLRMKITLALNVIWNCGYATLQLCLGVYHHSAWYYFLTGYYVSMAVMRIFLARHTFRFKTGENIIGELKRYRICGVMFLIMNLALSGMMLYMIRGERAVLHNEITTIAMATYTFASFVMAITGAVRYRKYNSPVYSATKAISTVSAAVSVMTLEDTMLSTFQNESMSPRTRQTFMTLTGAAVALFIVITAIYMIVKSNREIKSHMKLSEEKR